MISKRAFLARMAGGLAAGAGWFTCGSVAFKVRTAQAQTTPGQVLVMVFQRGGSDGLYLVAPYTDSFYYDTSGNGNRNGLRSTCMLEPPNQQDPESSIALGTMAGTSFGLNPNLAPMMEIFDAGNLAIIPAAHMRGSGRSHFNNQRWIGHGEVRGIQSGWMTRVLEASTNQDVFRGITAGKGDTEHELEGGQAYPAISRVTDYDLGGDDWISGDTVSAGCPEHQLLEHLRASYDATGQGGLAVNELAGGNGAAMVESLCSIISIDPNYTPAAGGLDYSNSNCGRGLRLVAQLIKAGIQLECVTVDWTGGWDSHNNQRPQGTSIVNSNSGLHRNQRDGAQNMLTFYRDMASDNLLNRVCVIVGTEFGRTSFQNGSSGTDHGYGAVWWVMGGTVNGGLQGGWPGVEENQLRNGRFLDATVDCRDIMGEAIVDHLGYPQGLLSSIFPGHTYADQGLIG